VSVSWPRALGVWLLIVLAETLHGIFRMLWLAPLAGDFRARQISVFTGSGLILAVTWLTRRWVAATTRRQQLAVGLGWTILTVLFEVGLGRLLGLPWARIREDYDLARGGLMLLGLVVMTFAPMIVATIASKRFDRRAAPARSG
jgi:hypothetical protein